MIFEMKSRHYKKHLFHQEVNLIDRVDGPGDNFLLITRIKIATSAWNNEQFINPEIMI